MSQASRAPTHTSAAVWEEYNDEAFLSNVSLSRHPSSQLSPMHLSSVTPRPSRLQHRRHSNFLTAISSATTISSERPKCWSWSSKAPASRPSTRCPSSLRLLFHNFLHHDYVVCFRFSFFFPTIFTVPPHPSFPSFFFALFFLPLYSSCGTN